MQMKTRPGGRWRRDQLFDLVIALEVLKVDDDPVHKRLRGRKILGAGFQHLRSIP